MTTRAYQVGQVMADLISSHDQRSRVASLQVGLRFGVELERHEAGYTARLSYGWGHPSVQVKVRW